MIIGIIGESCTGKSTIADKLSKELNATIYVGKDYLRLSKNEVKAKKDFIDLLKSNESSKDILIYIITEKDHLAFLPEKVLRVLITANLDIIKERFSKRINGKLSTPVANMLERKHGSFDNERYDLHFISGEESIETICTEIIKLCKVKD